MPKVCLVAILRPWGVTATQWPVVSRLQMTINSSKMAGGQLHSNVTKGQLNFAHFGEALVAKGDFVWH